LIHVPPGVYHGWKGVGTKEAIVVNVPTHPYNYEKPDEYRLDPYDNNIPYDWRLKEG
ncbi:dTDP-4-dehydrorhamnose 3,5-epimerase, partial [bacterium]